MASSQQPTWRRGTRFGHQPRFGDAGTATVPGRDRAESTGIMPKPSEWHSGTKFSQGSRFRRQSSSASPGPGAYESDATSRGRQQASSQRSMSSEKFSTSSIGLSKSMPSLGFSSTTGRFGSPERLSSPAMDLGPGSYNAKHPEWQWKQDKRLSQPSAAFVNKHTRTRLSFYTPKQIEARRAATLAARPGAQRGGRSLTPLSPTRRRQAHPPGESSTTGSESPSKRKSESVRGTSSFLSPTRTRSNRGGDSRRVRQVVAMFGEAGALGICFRAGVTPPVIESVDHTCSARTGLRSTPSLLPGMELVALQAFGGKSTQSELLSIRGLTFGDFEAILQNAVSSNVRPLILLFNQPHSDKAKSNQSQGSSYFSLQRSIQVRTSRHVPHGAFSTRCLHRHYTMRA